MCIKVILEDICISILTDLSYSHSPDAGPPMQFEISHLSSLDGKLKMENFCNNAWNAMCPWLHHKF